MPRARRAEFNAGVAPAAFCSHCGRAPLRRWASLPHRVCTHCRSGLVLLAPEGAQPRSAEPFVIVDQRLTVQALSSRAEDMLLVDEPSAVGVHLQEFLSSDDRKLTGDELRRLVELAIAGDEPDETVSLCTLGDPELPLAARVSSCGPPSAGLVVLGDRSASSEQVKP
jgi:ribosomal protein L32